MGVLFVIVIVIVIVLRFLTNRTSTRREETNSALPGRRMGATRHHMPESLWVSPTPRRVVAAVDQACFRVPWGGLRHNGVCLLLWVVVGLKIKCA